LNKKGCPSSWNGIGATHMLSGSNGRGKKRLDAIQSKHHSIPSNSVGPCAKNFKMGIPKVDRKEGSSSSSDEGEQIGCAACGEDDTLFLCSQCDILLCLKCFDAKIHPQDHPIRNLQ